MLCYVKLSNYLTYRFLVNYIGNDTLLNKDRDRCKERIRRFELTKNRQYTVGFFDVTSQLCIKSTIRQTGLKRKEV